MVRTCSRLLVCVMLCSCKGSGGDSRSGNNRAPDASVALDAGDTVAVNEAGEVCAVLNADGTVVLEADIELSGSPSDFTATGSDGSELRSSGEGNVSVSQLSGILVTIEGTRLEADTGCSLDLAEIW